MFNKIFVGMLSTLLLASLLFFAFNVQAVKSWTGTIYIRADGSIDPPTAPIQRDGDIYTLTDNITSDNDGIVIERDDMELDGAGHLVQGEGVGAGILLAGGRNITVKNVEITTFYYGIDLDTCQNCSVVGNSIHQTMFYGKTNIHLVNSRYNSIIGNNLTDCWIGIHLYTSIINVVRENNITKHSGGIFLDTSSDNAIYHNNLISNNIQAQVYDSANTWDDGYPSGGNLWSDYWGTDLYSGPYQNETGSDGIGDTPRIIDENNIDNYPYVYPRDPLEQQIVSGVNGSRAYDYDLELENIASGHYAFRSGGSTGANESANWIKEQFESFGLEAWLEPFEFTTWDLPSKPSFVIDDDGNPSTTYDQTAIESFQCEHYSWPTPQNGVFADLVILPLPEAAEYSEIGVNPINMTAWNAINTTGKIVLIGREVRWSSSWHQTYKNKLAWQPPAAIVHTWWYDWMSFTPMVYSSTGGRPMSALGHYYWDLGIPVGSVNYEEGLWIRSGENVLDVSANVSIKSVIGTGTQYNVVGRIRGYINPEKMVIISAHYDTVMDSGFCDNGAGTAGVLELAKVFAQAVESGSYKPIYTLIFVCFTSEELYLVGAINYIKQHKSDMPNIKAVINLDCIGSNDFYVSYTNAVGGFDLDEIVLEAARDLGVPAWLGAPGGSDQEAFRVPSWANSIYSQYWGLNAGISDAAPVESSTILFSEPLLYDGLWNMGRPGWIHTEYDNSTSTDTLSWVEKDDLQDHIKIAALSTVRISPSAPPSSRNIALVDLKPWKTVVGQTYATHINVTIENQATHIEYINVTIYVNTTVIAIIEDITVRNASLTTITLMWNTTGWDKGNYTITAYAWLVPDETNMSDNTLVYGTILVGVPGDVTGSVPNVPDGICNMRDIGAVCDKFGTTPAHSKWNANMDINNDNTVNMRDIGIACNNFMKT